MPGSYKLIPETDEQKSGYYALPGDRDLFLPGVLKESKDTSVLEFEKTPHSFPLDPYQAYKTRLLSFANGALFALIMSGKSFDEKNGVLKEIEGAQAGIKKRIASIKNLIANKLEELDELAKEMSRIQLEPVFETELFNFFNKELPRVAGLKSKEIAIAEAFYVWQMTTRPTRTTRYTTGDEPYELTIEQIETPRNAKLTKKQKEDLLSTLKKFSEWPQWFKDIFHEHIWLTHPIRSLVAEAKANEAAGKKDAWEKLEKSLPAILRHIPGEANATQHELIVRRRGGEIISRKTARRQGAPTSFKIRDKTARQTSAEENLRQMLDDELLPAGEESKAQIRFKQTWGFSPDKTIKLPVLLSGLVTPSEQAWFGSKVFDALKLSGDENNTKLAHEKAKAYAAYLREPNEHLANTKFFNLNVALNSQRGSDLAPDTEFFNFVSDFYKAIDGKLAEDDTKRDSLIKLDSIISTLKNFPREKIKGRNKNLALAALYDTSTRLMGGLSTGNCKSSKDRKGVAFIMADAIGIYCDEKFAKHETINLSDALFGEPDKKDRKRLVTIFCELYASGHELLVAHDGNPGSIGIKDEGILDEDIIDQLQSMKPNGWQKIRETIKPIASTVSLVIVGVSIALAIVLNPLALIALAVPMAIAGIIWHQDNELAKKRKDTRGVYAASKQLAEFNKPGSLWQKHKKKIIHVASIVSFFIVGVSVGLAVTLNPFTLIALAIPVAAVGIALYLDYKQAKKNKKYSFAAQIERARSLPNVSARLDQRSDNAIQNGSEHQNRGGSTKTFPFTPPLSYGEPGKLESEKSAIGLNQAQISQQAAIDAKVIIPVHSDVTDILDSSRQCSV